LATAFVLGNGTSRSPIPLDPLRKFGKIYACNAIYRDFDPDFLIAVDSKMIIELDKARYQYKVPVWTNENKLFDKMSGLNFFSPSKGWSSGPTALWLASEHKNKEIYILGFDYVGVGRELEQVNNIYAGTDNYKRKEERATYYGNWLKQTVATIQKFSKKRYIRVVKEDSFIPKDFQTLSNLEHITVAEFNKKFTTIDAAHQIDSL
jgi:hypothetical protein